LEQCLLLLDINPLENLEQAVHATNARKLLVNLEISKNEFELLVALFAESLIRELKRKEVEVSKFEARLNQMSLGKGSRQLLYDLNDELKRTMR
jgi:hypothetical protein